MLIYLAFIAFGFALGKWVGAGTGFVVWLLIRSQLSRKYPNQFKRANFKTSSDYPKYLFTLLGYSAKLNGTVTTTHIDFAQQIMQNFAGHVELKKMQNWFNDGKHLSAKRVTAMLIEMNLVYKRRGDIRFSFYEACYLILLNNGRLNALQKGFINTVASALNINADIVTNFESRIQNSTDKPIVTKIAVYFAQLGLNENASNDEVKQARKKLLNKYHPDKFDKNDSLQIQQANEKVDEINKAYQRIRDYRGF